MAQRPGVARAALRPPALPAGVEAGNLGSGPAAGASDPPGGATNTLVVIIDLTLVRDQPVRLACWTCPRAVPRRSSGPGWPPEERNGNRKVATGRFPRDQERCRRRVPRGLGGDGSLPRGRPGGRQGRRAPHSGGGRLERLPLLHDPVHSVIDSADRFPCIAVAAEPTRADDVLVAEMYDPHNINGMAGGETFGGVLQKQVRVTTRTFRSADSKDAYHVVIGAHQMNPRVM